MRETSLSPLSYSTNLRLFPVFTKFYFISSFFFGYGGSGRWGPSLLPIARFMPAPISILTSFCFTVTAACAVHHTLVATFIQWRQSPRAALPASSLWMLAYRTSRWASSRSRNYPICVLRVAFLCVYLKSVIYFRQFILISSCTWVVRSFVYFFSLIIIYPFSPSSPCRPLLPMAMHITCLWNAAGSWMSWVMCVGEGSLNASWARAPFHHSRCTMPSIFFRRIRLRAYLCVLSQRWRRNPRIGNGSPSLMSSSCFITATKTTTSHSGQRSVLIIAENANGTSPRTFLCFQLQRSFTWRNFSSASL